MDLLYIVFCKFENQIFEPKKNKQNKKKSQNSTHKIPKSINLQALMKQQVDQIEEQISKAQNENIKAMAMENKIDLNEFYGVLQPIMDSCTKDSISAGNPYRYIVF